MKSSGSRAAIPKRVAALPRHPAQAKAEPNSPPCHECAALCCQHYALEIDAPEDAEDFETLTWYLIHGNSWLWVDDGEWFLQVDQPCRFLDAINACTIYSERPSICREYGLPDDEAHPDDPLCDYFAQDVEHDLEFREPGEIRAYRDDFLRKRAKEKKRRSEAAKRGWRKRRAEA